ncbi:hypothetical protein K438DRAFT_371426 [Mycena galopus ATCC 62051]|nr:hypothetical protein K438DRAFT_371426 [Mycena galopus ATCC 62051]
MRSLHFTLVYFSLFTCVMSAVGAFVESPRSTELGLLFKRGGDEHGHHHAPIVEFNETDEILSHQPTPPSYYTIDWEDPDQADARHPGLIITHAVFMSLAFFVFLPMGITMRSLKHKFHGIAVFCFYASFILACAASSVYRKLTPDMYPGSTHATHGYRILAVALSLTLIDTLGALKSLFTFIRSAEHYTLKGIAHALLRGEDADDASAPECIPLIGEEADFAEGRKENRRSYDVPDTHHFHIFTSPPLSNVQTSMSPISNETLPESSGRRLEEILHGTHFQPRFSLLRRIGRAAFSVTERALLFGGFAQVLTGIVIYTGGCRRNYLNGCVGHLIKAGIFWCYGLVSFARFLGWCSERGWSWNRAPSPGHVTAEMVESTVIFLYGVTNTWVERIGAQPGDPFTTKQIQHIGIAASMAMESKTLHKWMAALAVDPSNKVSEDGNYTPSFNPFPAFVVGVTGAVMSAHAQKYVFQVQIHELWGSLLVAFAVLRCLTYFFLWVAPLRTHLPSRPPTEALGSFFLACGGLTFIFSTEEVTIMAMRRGRDDIMLFAVIAVAMTCLAFSWIICVVGFHGWLKTRTMRAVLYRSPT